MMAKVNVTTNNINKVTIDILSDTEPELTPREGEKSRKILFHINFLVVEPILPIVSLPLLPPCHLN